MQQSLQQNPDLHTLAHVVINDLQKAYITCPDSPTDGYILSALMTAKKVHDQLLGMNITISDVDPEEYCCAI